MNKFKILTFIILLFFTATSFAITLRGRVIAVTDGDTVKVLDNANHTYKIRMLGIDAPEKKQSFGMASKKNLSDLIFGRNVVVVYDKTDRYQRILGKIIYNHTDINHQQIADGMSWVYIQYIKELAMEERLAYLSAEREARINKKGLWENKDPIAPWEFRRSRKNSL